MRKYSESTARNLLRKPLVLGVPLIGLILLSFVVLTTNLIGGQGRLSSTVSLLIAIIGYGFLRTVNRIAKNGWEEKVVYKIEGLSKKRKLPQQYGDLVPAHIEIQSADTLDDDELVQQKETLREWLRDIKRGTSVSLFGFRNHEGFTLHKVSQSGSLEDLTQYKYAYSLYQLPVSTCPLWLTAVLDRVSGEVAIGVRFESLDFWKTKSRIEQARRSNARDDSRISNIDSEISFEESSRVLEGLSRGDEKIYEASLVIFTKKLTDFDPDCFCLEEQIELPIKAITGERKRFFRSFLIRECTATDLIPNLQDPLEIGLPILKTRRGSPLYFSPLDKRLEALHWLIVGATGSGKSMFTGLVLSRLIEQSKAISVLFVDHKRSFKRFVKSKAGVYLEPQSLLELTESASSSINSLNRVGSIAGIELSDLTQSEKKEAAHFVLSSIESFLSTRNSIHPIYIVLDECWNFMRDEPMLVQRAFREFRKLNGAAVAITQSLADFLTDEAGQSIYQNAPIRIILRQGEDVTRYQGILGLNSREVSLVKTLQQKKPLFSECLIKTPFLSRVGRLYPSDAEYELLRTDNLREEYLKETKEKAAVSEALCGNC